MEQQVNEPGRPRRTGPLAGVKVLDMSSVVFGPMGTLVLADLGADVIKVEHTAGANPGDLMRYAGASPTGDLGPLFMALNRNKRTVTIDATTPDGKALLERLLAEADVFFHNVRMAGMARLDLDYESVRELKPDILYVHCAGYGEGGPYSDRQAYDDLVQAASGYSDLERIRSGADPQYAPSVIADKSAGLFAAYATMAGLFHRERTGEGQFVQVPLYECFTFFNLVENLYGETYPPGNGKYAYTRSVNPNRKPYRTRDGHIAILPYSDAHWAKFFELGGRPGVFDDPRFSTHQARTEHTGELYGIIEEVAASKTTEEWLEILHDANIPAMRYYRMHEVASDPHLNAVGFFETVDHPAAGPYVSMRHPVTFSVTPPDNASLPPVLGEHTEEIARNGWD